MNQTLTFKYSFSSNQFGGAGQNRRLRRLIMSIDTILKDKILHEIELRKQISFKRLRGQDFAKDGYALALQDITKVLKDIFGEGE